MTGAGVPSKQVALARRALRALRAGRAVGTLAVLNARRSSRQLRRILIFSDGQNYTSEQQFAPLLRHRQEIARRLGLVFDFAGIDRVAGPGSPNLSGCTAVGLKLGFLTPAEEAARIAERLFAAARATRARTIVFDGDDDLCVLWPAVIEAADVYIKKHRFADDAGYARSYVGKTNLTDYVHHTYGTEFADDPIPKTGALSPSQIGKIVLGWNIALDDKIFDLSRDLSPDVIFRARDIDIGCRASVRPDNWIYDMRHAATSAMEGLRGDYRVHAPTERVPQQEYYNEMLRARLSVSPFGFGELCWRDFETILCGSVLVKPDMSHAETWPDLFVPGETYIPVAWDFSDLREACAPWLDDETARRRMAEMARARLLDALSPDSAIARIGDVMARAGLA